MKMPMTFPNDQTPPQPIVTNTVKRTSKQDPAQRAKIAD